MKQIVRVLHVVTIDIINGGIETVIRNICKSCIESDIRIDVLTGGGVKNQPFSDFVKSCGGSVFELKIENSRNIIVKIKYYINTYLKMRYFLDNNSYDFVHIHAPTFTIAYFAILACKKRHHKILLHSHMDEMYSLKKRIIRSVFINIFPSVYKYVACSNAAAHYFFKPNIINSSKYTLLNNAIDCNRFAFNAEIRKKVRHKFNLGGKYVIGHVGRFELQKNHAFLIDIFKEICIKDSNAILFLVGEGSLENEIKLKVKQLGINDRVIFYGVTEDSSSMYQAFDVFLFPSFHEGLGIVAIEAQAAGLPVIMSENIPIEANVLDSCKRIPLSLSPLKWADSVMGVKSYVRTNHHEQLKNAGFDLEDSVSTIKALYS